MSVSAPLHDIDTDILARSEFTLFSTDCFLDIGYMYDIQGTLSFVRLGYHLGDGEIEPEFFIALPFNEYNHDMIINLYRSIYLHFTTISSTQMPEFFSTLGRIANKNGGNWFNGIISNSLYSEINKLTDYTIAV